MDLSPAQRLRLLADACRLHRRAQGLGVSQSWREVQTRMLALRPGLSAIEPGDAIWAARWAARLLHRLFGMRDTCLLRSLVAGSLVADRPRVAVAVGVRTDPSAGTLLRAHAWLTIEDEAVAMAAEADKDPFESVLTLPMERLA